MQSGLPRIGDVLIAFTALLTLFPLLAVIAIVVGVSSKGPIIFRQKRVGLRGRLFTLYKFRTMTDGAVGPQVTASNDSRVTVVGRFLRRTKLDELPEFWNVIKGDMSLVGPRPEVEQYVDWNNPGWTAILQVRPGVTDPVTLQLRNEEHLLNQLSDETERFYLEVLQPLKLRGYADYIRRRTWRSDLYVLFQTAVVLVSPIRH